PPSQITTTAPAPAPPPGSAGARPAHAGKGPPATATNRSVRISKLLSEAPDLERLARSTTTQAHAVPRRDASTDRDVGRRGVEGRPRTVNWFDTTIASLITAARTARSRGGRSASTHTVPKRMLSMSTCASQAPSQALPLGTSATPPSPRECAD